MSNEIFTMQGDEKERYLGKLDAALGVLATQIAHDVTLANFAPIREYGERHGWDLTGRMPHMDSIPGTFSSAVTTVRSLYDLFRNHTQEPDPKQNRSYFSELEFHATTGMPLSFAVRGLYTLKDDIGGQLRKFPTMPEAAASLASLLASDTTPVNQVPQEAATIKEGALKRSFLEYLASYPLPAYSTQSGIDARLITEEGAESLWSLNFTRLDMVSGFVTFYQVDLWQDFTGRLIQAKPNGVEINTELRQILEFTQRPDPWYLLGKIDERFENIHPVHLSRCTIGPFESRYMTAEPEVPRLQFAQGIYKSDPEAAFLRCGWQYAFAPKSVDTTRKKAVIRRQDLVREDWRSEVLVVPAQHTAAASQAALGTGVRVYAYDTTPFTQQQNPERTVKP